MKKNNYEDKYKIGAGTKCTNENFVGLIQSKKAKPQKENNNNDERY